MADQRRISILAIGDNTVDVYVDKGVMFPGGNAVNVAVMAARLGADAAYIGCLARDSLGDLVRAALLSEGLDLSHCRRADGENACAVVGHKNGDRVFLGSRPGVRGRIALGPADHTYATHFDIVHTSVNSDLDAALPALANHAKLLSYDFSDRIDDDRLALPPFIDVAFLSFGARPEEDCLARMATWSAANVPVVVGTRGAFGALALSGGNVVRQPVVPTRVVDTLGAGDGFIAGFLVEHAKGGDLAAALAAGARNAAVACADWGGFGYGKPITARPDARLPWHPPTPSAPPNGNAGHSLAPPPLTEGNS